MHVTSVHLYPVKSLGGQRVASAYVEPWGLRGDRRWGLIDPVGAKVTAREVNALLGLVAEPLDGGGLRIRDGRDGDDLVVDEPVGGDVVGADYSRLGSATLASAAAHAWLSARAGRAVHLVWLPDPTARSIAPDHGGQPGESLNLADAGPVLLVSEASVGRLNEWIAEHDDTDPIGVERFRPNVVVDGDDAFAEESWSGVRLGDVDFRTTMICDRCVMTTIDLTTLRTGKEPIRSLARHHRWDGTTWFGTRLVAATPGTIRVGDPVVPRPA